VPGGAGRRHRGPGDPPDADAAEVAAGHRGLEAAGLPGRAERG
jgi:hypothetical protein